MSYQSLFSHLALNQAGALWIHVLIWFWLLGDHRRVFSRRNVVIGLLLLPAVAQYDLMLWEKNLGEPGTGWLLGAAFSVLFGITAWMAVWSLVLAFGRARLQLGGDAPRPAVIAVLAAAGLLNLAVIFGRAPEDAGYYTSLGAQRWVETGTMPYGDEKLRGPDSPAGGAAATYGPLLYVAHLPFHVVVGTEFQPPDADPTAPEYVRAPNAVTRLTCFSFHLAGILALFVLARRLAGTDKALTLVAVYASSSYLLGLGSDGALSSGLVYISHVAPSAVTLLALLALRRPALAGVLLASACGLLFYPAFLAPLFLGWYAGRGRGIRAFAVGFVGAGLAIAALVFTCTGNLGDRGPVALFFESTLEHQEGAGQYGDSLFSFWGTHPEWKDMFQRPLIGDSSLFKLSFLIVAGFSLLGFFLARRRSVAQLALLIAAVTAAIQLWKTHAGGTYVMWYLPFLLLGLFTRTEGLTAPAAVVDDVEGEHSNI